VANQVVSALEDAIEKKKLPKTLVGSIRSRLMVFVRSDIENPTFDSQSKDTLTKKSTDFGSTCELPKSFLAKVVRESGIVQDIEAIADMKSRAELAKLSKSSSKRGLGQVIDVPKLEDAHDAGTKSSLDCTLILTEGDSAKALAVAGIEVVGRKKYGVLPLRGKILNVRDVKYSKVSENAELVNLVKALGKLANELFVIIYLRL
jgi:DNA topoisomerase II